MRMKWIFAGLFSLLAISVTRAQEPVTLPGLFTAAEAHYPALQQKALLEQASRENQQLLDASLLPQLNVTGQAAYQSEVTKFAMPGVSSDVGQKPFNYNTGLEIRMPLTQFGTVATRKQLEQAQTNVALSQVDADLQRLRERITNLFGNILLQRENIDILNIRLSDLDSQRARVAVGVANGAVLRSNQLVLESEILSTRQRIEDINGTVNSLLTELNTLTGLMLDTATSFDAGDRLRNADSVNRPELKVFSAQEEVLQYQSDLLKKENRPNIYLFGQGMFGRPGYNFLDNQARVYGIGGVGLSWNLNNLFNQSKRLRSIDISKQILSKQQETFLLNLQASLAAKSVEIAKYERIIANDEAIVSKRGEILAAAKSQLENGVITSTDYLAELNAENTARLNSILHRVQLAVARAQYNTLLGY